MVVQIRILNGKCQGMVFDLTPQTGDLFVGQRETAQIRLDDPWISWDHARIFHKNNEVFLEDLASTNGTFIDLQRVRCERLTNGNVVFFGKTHALFTQNNEVGGSNFQRDLDMAANSDRLWRQEPGPFDSGGLPGNSPFSMEEEALFSESDPFSSRVPDPFAEQDDFELFESSQNFPAPPPGLLGGPRPDAFDLGPPPVGFERPPSGPNQALFNAGAPGPMPGNVDNIEKLLSTSSIDDLDDLLQSGGLQPAPYNELGSLGSALPPPPPPTGSFTGSLGPLPPPPPPSGPSLAPDNGNPVHVDNSIGHLPKSELVRRLSLLDGENKRLKGAFQAAQAQRHDAVLAAAQALRDQELGRLNNLLADARAELTRVREELERRSEELDAVTEEMIEKEDTIQTLEDTISRLREGDDVVAI